MEQVSCSTAGTLLLAFLSKERQRYWRIAPTKRSLVRKEGPLFSSSTLSSSSASTCRREGERMRCPGGAGSIRGGLGLGGVEKGPNVGEGQSGWGREPGVTGCQQPSRPLARQPAPAGAATIKQPLTSGNNHQAPLTLPRTAVGSASVALSLVRMLSLQSERNTRKASLDSSAAVVLTAALGCVAVGAGAAAAAAAGAAAAAAAGAGALLLAAGTGSEAELLSAMTPCSPSCAASVASVAAGGGASAVPLMVAAVSESLSSLSAPPSPPWRSKACGAR